MFVTGQLRQLHVSPRGAIFFFRRRLLPENVGKRGSHFLQRLLSEVSFRGQAGQANGEPKLVWRDWKFSYLESQFGGSAATGIIGHFAQASHSVKDGLLVGAPGWFDLSRELGEGRQQDDSGENDGSHSPSIEYLNL
jgi:hypothetical protein